MKRKLMYSLLGVLLILAFTVGGTFAYYEAMTSNNITGEAKAGINTTLKLDKTYKASKLVPLNDNLVQTAISKSSNKCIDNSGYEVCSLYKITLTNTYSSESLYGYIKTNTSGYTTDNLKYQIYNSNFTALTDVMTLSRTANEVVYFKKNAANHSVISSGTTTYYLVIWLTDTGSEQSQDYSKTYSGTIGFETIEETGNDEGKIEAGFTS